MPWIAVLQLLTCHTPGDPESNGVTEESSQEILLWGWGPAIFCSATRKPGMRDFFSQTLHHLRPSLTRHLLLSVWQNSASEGEVTKNLKSLIKHLDFTVDDCFRAAGICVEWVEVWRERKNDSIVSVMEQLSFVTTCCCYVPFLSRDSWAMNSSGLYMCTQWNLGLYLPLRRGRVFLSRRVRPNIGECLKVDKVRLPPSTDPGRSAFPLRPLPPLPGASTHNGILVPQKEFCRCQPCKHHPPLWSFSEEKKFGLPLANQLSFTKDKFKSLALVQLSPGLLCFDSSIPLYLLPFSLLYGK